MSSITEMEHCSIIDAICPYDYSCGVCRLHNDYEEAQEKSRRLAAGKEGKKSD